MSFRQGQRAVVAESLLLKHQLLVSSRARRRAPNLNTFDRLFLGLGSLFIRPSRIPKLAVILKPRTLFKFHEALTSSAGCSRSTIDPRQEAMARLG